MNGGSDADSASLDWTALQVAVRGRRRQLRLSQTALYQAGGPAPSTLRSIESGARVSLRRPARRSLERALGWRKFHVDEILHGGAAAFSGDAEVVHGALTASEAAAMACRAHRDLLGLLPDADRQIGGRRVAAQNAAIDESLAVLAARPSMQSVPVAVMEVMLRSEAMIDQLAGRRSGARAEHGDADLLGSLLADGVLVRSRVSVSALTALAAARLSSAEALVSTDGASAALLARSAARQAMLAVLAAEGLRVAEDIGDGLVAGAVEAVSRGSASDFAGMIADGRWNQQEPEAVVAAASRVIEAASATLSTRCGLRRGA
ncbi:hypothetical protein [Gordonia malaquae]|uniref:hypothetical protein n=1 Tax=Gordonia malaquae TaxID=410332 RepID=UPI00301B0903